MKSKLTAIVLALAVGAFGAQCDDGGDSNDEALLLGLAALTAQAGNNSALSEEQQAAANTANSAANVSGTVASAANSGGQTAMHLKRDQAIAGLLGTIIKNGRDPYLVREEIKRIHGQFESGESPENKVQLAALMFESDGTDAEGHNQYTFSGTVSGIGTAIEDFPIGQYNPYIEDSCTVSVQGIDFNTEVGTATITNGTLTFDGSGDGTSFSGTSTQTYDASFDDFGAAYFDYYSYLKFIKDNGIGGGFTDPTQIDCATITALYETVNTYLRNPTLNSGSMSAEYTSTYSSSQNASSFTSNYTSQATSTDGVVIDGANTTFDITVELNSSVNTGSSGAVVGSYSISFNGTVNGTALNEELSISFP